MWPSAAGFREQAGTRGCNFLSRPLSVIAVSLLTLERCGIISRLPFEHTRPVTCCALDRTHGIGDGNAYTGGFGVSAARPRLHQPGAHASGGYSVPAHRARVGVFDWSFRAASWRLHPSARPSKHVRTIIYNSRSTKSESRTCSADYSLCEET